MTCGDFLPLSWTDCPENPVIRPPWPEFLIADPTFATPAETPDGAWHLFAHGIVAGIHHFRSEDGVRWNRIGRVGPGLRPYLFRGADWILFHERIVSPLRSVVAIRRSSDLVRWSRPEVVLEPSLPWEGRLFSTNGNPCLADAGGSFRLYYSAGLSWLADCGFPEPRFIGVAQAERPEGPFVKEREPMLSPSPAIPHRNLGAGSIKVVRDPATGRWLGFHNGIYVDSRGRSRSDIRLLVSPDGLQWVEALDRPLVAPEPGWKAGLVYACDVRLHVGEWRMYYNARDGWALGVERIGMATSRRLLECGGLPPF